MRHTRRAARTRSKFSRGRSARIPRQHFPFRGSFAENEPPEIEGPPEAKYSSRARERERVSLASGVAEVEREVLSVRWIPCRPSDSRSAAIRPHDNARGSARRKRVFCSRDKCQISSASLSHHLVVIVAVIVVVGACRRRDTRLNR